MEYAQLGIWGNIPWKYQVNPFNGLGGDVWTRLDKETKTNKQKEEQTGQNDFVTLMSQQEQQENERNIKTWIERRTRLISIVSKPIKL